MLRLESSPLGELLGSMMLMAVMDRLVELDVSAFVLLFELVNARKKDILVLIIIVIFSYALRLKLNGMTFCKRTLIKEFLIWSWKTLKISQTMMITMMMR